MTVTFTTTAIGSTMHASRRPAGGRSRRPQRRVAADRFVGRTPCVRPAAGSGASAHRAGGVSSITAVGLTTEQYNLALADYVRTAPLMGM